MLTKEERIQNYHPEVHELSTNFSHCHVVLYSDAMSQTIAYCN